MSTEISRVLITGASGLVGSKLVEISGESIEYHAIGRKLDIKLDGIATYQICDLEKATQLEKIIATTPSDSVLHLAAITDVDAVEAQRKFGPQSSAWKINVGVPEHLAQLCEKYEKRLIFASTSYVFDGRNGPYKESDSTLDSQPELMSFYSTTKLEAEKRIVDNTNNWLMLRFEMPYRSNFSGKNDFAKKFLQFYKDGKLTHVFADQSITPILVDDLTDAFVLVIKSNAKGVFHVGSKDLTTPFNFAKELIEQYFDEKFKAEPTSYADYQRPQERAPRPYKGGVIMQNILTLGFSPRTNQQMIEEYCLQLKDK